MRSLNGAGTQQHEKRDEELVGTTTNTTIMRRALLPQQTRVSSSRSGSSSANSKGNEGEPDENENEPSDENSTTTTKTTTIITTIATPSPNSNINNNNNNLGGSGTAKVNTTVIIEKTTNTTTNDGSGSLDESLGHDGAPLSVGAIVGITLAGTAVIALLVFLVFRFMRKKRRTLNKQEKHAYDVNGITPHSSAAYSGNMNASGKSGGATASRSNNTTSSSIRGKESSLWDDNEIIALRIPLEKIVKTNLISRGGYGEVYFGTYKDQQVAIKTLLPDMRRDLKQINAFLAETKLMAALEHPNIVRFIGVAWDSLADLCVVSEFMEGGDLRALLTRFETEERRPHGFDHDKVKIAFHVAHAITYLHSLDPIVLHRDLKSKNILLDGNLDAKVTDFGVSRESSDKTMTAGVGTSLWMAPEVMMGERYDDKADIFSFGVVLSELDSHGLPYAQAKSTHSGRQLPDTALLQMVSLGRLKVELSGNAPQALVDLAAACTALNPKDRPNAVEVVYKLQLALKTYTDYVF